MTNDDPILPIDVRLAIPALSGQGWRKLLRVGLENLLGLPRVRETFASGECASGPSYFAAAKAFRLEYRPPASGKIPSNGPVIVVANHPFGGADALTLGAVCETARPDNLMLGNLAAAMIPCIAPVTLPLTIMGANQAASANAGTLRKALAHLRKGGCLSVFPSGEVASWRGAGVEEAPWSVHIAALARRASATVVPVRFFGINPPWFHLLGGIHPLLRTAVIPRLLLLAAGKPIVHAIGAPILPGKHADMSDHAFSNLMRGRLFEIPPPDPL